MTFQEAVAFLQARVRHGARPELQRITALMEALDNPQRSYPSIHVTGTNGKYSVCAMSAAVLNGLGLRVGTSPSPWIETIRERVQIDGQDIDEEGFAGVVAYLKPYVEMVEAELGDELTYFELLTAMAFEHFFDRAVHAAVVEVGFGGEYDATNVIEGRVAVITRVHRDHIPQFVSDTRQAAWEKAGIIKPGAVVLSGVEQPELREIVQERARERGAARVAWLGEDFGIESRSPAVGGQLVAVKGLERTYEDLYLPVHGAHQATNAAFAVAACEAFGGGALDSGSVRATLGTLSMPGRLEVAGRRPLVVLDGGHNPDAARAVIATLQGEFAYERVVAVIGMLEDKLIDEVMALMAPAVHEFFVTAPDEPRAAAPDRIAAAVRSAGVGQARVHVVTPVTDAISAAVEIATADDLVLVFGSFSTIGEAKPWLRLAGLGG